MWVDDKPKGFLRMTVFTQSGWRLLAMIWPSADRARFKFDITNLDPEVLGDPKFLDE
jgi:hypothetical protein